VLWHSRRSHFHFSATHTNGTGGFSETCSHRSGNGQIQGMNDSEKWVDGPSVYSKKHYGSVPRAPNQYSLLYRLVMR
jgi:hypothetical protein